MFNKRVGANRQRHIEEQRAHRPRVIRRAFRKWSKAGAVAAAAVAAGIAIFMYSPGVYAKAAQTILTGRRLCASVKITNCGKRTEASLKNALDSLAGADSLAFDRANVLKVASAIPEIEKVSVRKCRDRANHEMVTSIKVVERKPVALVHDGGICLVDKNGIRFAPRPGQYYDLPLILVDSVDDRDTVDLQVFNAIKKASRNLGGAFFDQISQINLCDSSALNLIFKSGEAEYLVGYEDLEERLVHIKTLRERLLEENGEPARIDMRYRSLAVTSSM
jgi:cell division septal protein FtsQ